MPLGLYTAPPIRAVGDAGIVPDLNAVYAQVRDLTVAADVRSFTTTPAPMTFSVVAGMAFNNTVGNADYGKGNVGNSTTDLTSFISVVGGTTVTLTASHPINVYGYTYDAAGATIAPIRDVNLFATLLSTYSFVAPANAATLRIYCRYLDNNAMPELAFTSSGGAASITVTYQYPLNPKNYAGATFAVRYAAAALVAVQAGGLPIHITEDASVTSTLFLYPSCPVYLHSRLTLAVGAYTNIFRNAATANPASIPLAADTNIKLLGFGRAELKGSAEAWGSDSPANVGAEAWRSINLLLANVDGFEVSGIKFTDTNSWASCFEQCRYGKITNIVFDQKGSHPNQDGIDIRRGTHDVLIENISGGTYDDMIALTNLVNGNQVNILSTTIFDPASTTLDIHDIVIRNIVRKYTSQYGVLGGVLHYWGGILMLCASNLKIYNVTIDGVTGIQQIYVGLTAVASYGTAAVYGDYTNIHVSNTQAAPVYTNSPLKNCSFTNIARMDTTNTYNCVVLPTGSQKVRRTYQDGTLEYFATV